MALTYYPSPGEVLLCDYGDNSPFQPPEMRKRRPVVVVSPRLRKRPDLIAVVPLSTSKPDPYCDHHCEIALVAPLPRPFDEPTMWAKCDMVGTVALSRLDRFKDGRNAGGGARRFRTGKLDAVQLRNIRVALLYGLGLGSLTVNL